MTEYSKYNLVYRLQKWMDSVPGQTFLNYPIGSFYLVILGTLFKFDTPSGANIVFVYGYGNRSLHDSLFLLWPSFRLNERL